MTVNLSQGQIIRIDQGEINTRLLARVAKADYRRVEAASIKMTVRLSSAEGKRLFIRHFSALQLHVHFIGVIARTRLETSEVEQVENAIRARLDEANQCVVEAINGVEALFKSNGITTAATYDNEALEIEVGVISSFGRRFLDTIGLFDQLMPYFQTLEIFEVLKPQDIEAQRALLKRKMRDAPNAARYLAFGFRKRMNDLAIKETAAAIAPAEGEGKEDNQGEEAAVEEPIASADEQTDEEADLTSPA
jgi:hypothetical protein